MFVEDFELRVLPEKFLGKSSATWLGANVAHDSCPLLYPVGAPLIVAAANAGTVHISHPNMTTTSDLLGMATGRKQHCLSDRRPPHAIELLRGNRPIYTRSAVIAFPPSHILP